MFTESKGLEEYPIEDLREEIRRRKNAIMAGMCPYCKHPGNVPTCKMTDQHSAASHQLKQLSRRKEQ